ncbi:TetR/AcrR family transcriptional regulator [Antarctobacter sp.]|uniref:TetR/AcrR family transcriptional regulator n=1 Tax=Antarctobacter sp. TaxID=1872577 RepID=UPI002B27B1C2|nr:TetR/AcrR family transcriptional regulator [Antarctobacter sp.]
MDFVLQVCNHAITAWKHSKSTGDNLNNRTDRPRVTEIKERNSVATKEALLAAARVEFQKAGYVGASTRKIASDAGCNAALINRYFGSKAGLFDGVMEACIDLDALECLSNDEIVSALADIALSKAELKAEFDPIVVAIKSSGSPDAQLVVRNRLGNPMVEQLASLIGGESAEQKAGVILSLISGMYVGRVSVGAQALSQSQNETIRPMLTAALRAILTSERT